MRGHVAVSPLFFIDDDLAFRLPGRKGLGLYVVSQLFPALQLECPRLRNSVNGYHAN